MAEVTVTIALSVAHMQEFRNWLAVQCIDEPDGVSTALGLLRERTDAALKRARARGRIIRAHSPSKG